jgi:hypothetical protein
MKNKFIYLCILLLISGCSTTSANLKFPEVPTELMKSCGNLELVKQDDHQFSNFLNIIVDNYSTYYECKIQADGWQRWYEDHRKIFNEANK